MSASIGILTCYLGQWPWYFPYFLHSCRFNPTIDFILITDNQSAGYAIPDNVHIVFSNLEAIRANARKKLGFSVAIEDAYKLCDFKPAFGLLFSEELHHYDFWGHGDIDMIYGDIRSFVTDEITDNYDVIAVRNEYITGFFSLFRNKALFNTLFQNSRDYPAVLQTTGYLGFDECSLLAGALSAGHVLEDLPAEIDSMTHIVKRLHNGGVIRAYFDHHVVESIPGDLLWDNGRLLFKNEYEALLYHLNSFKVHSLLQIPEWPEVPDRFFINEFSFSK
ncbi:DUF6625 family protein [Puia dinghuensis]|uniref:Uncharacterized protein n=1 Tax=Puia dinghuensis TaxID=1792502 RepID=A0A8J2XUL6_9BACT|nr:DUF6625 family protein [Puia dinghuensis]GGB11592.1 hypothetical protein GCM10011511_39030 [Puia dinghuensis]